MSASPAFVLLEAVALNSSPFYSPGTLSFRLTEANLLPFYEQVIREGKLRILIYNGDADPSINSFVTQDRYTDYFDQQVSCSAAGHYVAGAGLTRSVYVYARVLT